MSVPVTRESRWEMLTDYLDGAMSPADRRKFEAFLASDHPDAAELRAYAEFRPMLTELPEPRGPSVVESVREITRAAKGETFMERIAAFFKNSPVLAAAASLSAAAIVFVAFLALQDTGKVANAPGTDIARNNTGNSPPASNPLADAEAVKAKIQGQAQPDAGKLLERIFKESKQAGNKPSAAQSDGGARFLEILRQSQQQPEQSVTGNAPFEFTAQMGVYKGAIGGAGIDTEDAKNPLDALLKQNKPAESAASDETKTESASTGDAAGEDAVNAIFLRMSPSTAQAMSPQLLTKNPPASLDVLGGIRGTYGLIALDVHVDSEGKVSKIVEPSGPPSEASAKQFTETLKSAIRDWRFQPARSGVRPVQSIVHLEVGKQ